jgi:hypothetical protein
VQLCHGPVMVCLHEVQIPHTNLEDALVQVAHIVRLFEPHRFERFVTLKKLAPVELCNAEQQSGRGRFLASASRVPGVHSLARGYGVAVQGEGHG